MPLNPTRLRISHYTTGLGLLIALLAALRFNGVALSWYALALSALFVALGVRLFQAYDHGLRLPRDALPVTLTLFWAWLALTVAWSPTPYLSLINVWWVGSLPFAFWLYRLAPEPDRLWRGVFSALVLLGAALAVYALVQFAILHADPRATFLNRNSLAAFLNLLVLPLAASYLCLTPAVPADIPPAPAWAGRVAALRDAVLPVLLPAIMLLLVSVIGLSRSRGALLGLFLGSAILLLTLWQLRRTRARAVSVGAVPRQPSFPGGWRRLLVLVLVLLGGLIIADMLRDGQVISRLASLDHPHQAGADRFLIWGPAWQLLWHQPWHTPWLGTGLGTFWLAFPPYRLPADTSAGFYVHNDYLQLWIETGLPGLLLWLSVLGATLIAFLRLLRQRAGQGTAAHAPTRTGTSTITDAHRTVLAAGLLGGLGAMALHSAFTFNLYTQPIIVLAGILLGRFHLLATRGDDPGAAPGPVWTLAPARYMSRAAYRLIVVIGLVAALTLLPFGSLALSLDYVQRAREAVAHGQLLVANRLLDRAETFAPGLDTTWYMHGDLLMRALSQLPPDAPASQRRTLYTLALDKLARAQATNPLRAQTHMVRGDLYFHNPALAGAHSRQLAAAQYRDALRLDPRYVPARLALARLYAVQGQALRALTVLKGGLAYWYPPTASTVRYYQATEALARHLGDHSATTWVAINASLLGLAPSLVADGAHRLPAPGREPGH